MGEITMKKFCCSLFILFLGLIPFIHFADAMEHSSLANTIFAKRTKTAPIIFSAESPGTLHIMNNECFPIAYYLGDFKWKHNRDGYLQPNEEVTLDLKDFSGFSKLVIFKVDRDNITNQALWVPKSPYIWSFTSEMFKSQGGVLYTIDAYVPIEED